MEKSGIYAAIMVMLLGGGLFFGCEEKKESLDVNQFPTECLKNCALAFNGCNKLARNEQDTKRCQQYFDRCKGECERKERGGSAPAPAPSEAPAKQP